MEPERQNLSTESITEEQRADTPSETAKPLVETPTKGTGPPVHNIGQPSPTLPLPETEQQHPENKQQQEEQQKPENREEQELEPQTETVIGTSPQVQNNQQPDPTQCLPEQEQPQEVHILLLAI